jgi:hypothetical protein
MEYSTRLSPHPAQPTGGPNGARLLLFGVYGVNLEAAS